MLAEFGSHFSASDVSSPQGARQAALALHGMAVVDRDWMLQQIGAERRVVLERLLAELRELGMPPLRLPLVEKQDASAADVPAREVLNRLSGEQLHALLRDEPDGLIADVLGGLGPFRDEAELRRLLRASGRTVEPGLQVGSPPARRADALAQVLVRRAAAMRAIKADMPIASSSRPLRWFERLRPWRTESGR